ncbi:MAG: YgjV family protein [Pseudomonadota bacterium]
MISFPYILAQLFGTAAFGFQVFSAQAKQRSTLTLFLGFSNIFWVAHYIVLNIPLAAMIAGLIAIQLIVSSVVDPKYRKPIIIVFIILYWIAAYFTLEETSHLLPVVGSSILSLTFLMSGPTIQLLPVVGTSTLSLSLLVGDSAKIVRIGAIISFSLWMTHGFFTGSIIEVVANGIPLAAALFGLFFKDIEFKRPSWLQVGQTSKTHPKSDK